ncbi:U7 snRNA-associated Sm-like protein LSm11 [Argonauta hians]
MAEKSEEENEGELDFTSPNFNPELALRLGNVKVPYPNIKTLNNLAEYRSLVTGTAAVKKAGTSASGESSQLEKVKPSKTAPTPEKEERKEEQTTEATSKPSRHNRNVFTRMETHHNDGPLSLLRRCVYDKLRVKVWTRSAGYIRGFCRGFIVAYDKHLNMAMIDVDEIYRKPIYPTHRKRDITVFPIIPSDTPENSDNDSGDDYSYLPDSSSDEDRKDTNLKRSCQERHNLNKPSKCRVETFTVALPGPKLPKVCLSSKIEPCLVYNRLKTKVCERHVNQLFIRGDSVVSVAITD